MTRTKVTAVVQRLKVIACSEASVVS